MLRSPVSISVGESPLTDPRSVGSSAVFHVIVVLLASLTALNVALPMATSRPKALYAEIDPVDNRADVPSSPGQGGGNPGNIGGMNSLPFVPPSDGTTPQGATRDPVADTLLAEILPTSQPRQSESVQRALPGPQTTGQGLIPGSGSGGGGAQAAAPVTVRVVASDPAPSFSGHAIMLTPLRMSLTAPAAWPPVIRWKLLNVKCLPALASFRQTLSLP